MAIYRHACNFCVNEVVHTVLFVCFWCASSAAFTRIRGSKPRNQAGVNFTGTAARNDGNGRETPCRDKASTIRSIVVGRGSSDGLVQQPQCVKNRSRVNHSGARKKWTPKTRGPVDVHGAPWVATPAGPHSGQSFPTRQNSAFQFSRPPPCSRTPLRCTPKRPLP